VHDHAARPFSRSSSWAAAAPASSPPGRWVALLAMSARDLNDLGIGRCEVEHFTR
jgi:hypothetical protein